MDSEKKIEEKPLDFYLNLNYPVTLYPEDEGGFTVEIMDLPGCLSQEETVEEAFKMIAEARELWIETAYENGDPIPMPSTETSYSGETTLRMPKSLHRKLAESAKREDVSLDQYIVTLLSQQSTASELSAIQTKLDEIQQQLDRKAPINYPSEKRAAQARVIRELTLND